MYKFLYRIFWMNVCVFAALVNFDEFPSFLNFEICLCATHHFAIYANWVSWYNVTVKPNEDHCYCFSPWFSYGFFACMHASECDNIDIIFHFRSNETHKDGWQWYFCARLSAYLRFESIFANAEKIRAQKRWSKRYDISIFEQKRDTFSR